MFKRKKPKKISIVNVSLPILIRQAIYDSVFDDQAEEIAEMMGLSPISKEVSEMERRDSSERISKLSALIPLIDSLAGMSAQIAASAYIIETKEAGMEDSLIDIDNLEALAELFKTISLSSAVSCIATLINLELIDCNVKGQEHQHE